MVLNNLLEGKRAMYIITRRPRANALYWRCHSLDHCSDTSSFGTIKVDGQVGSNRRDTSYHVKSLPYLSCLAGRGDIFYFERSVT